MAAIVLGGIGASLGGSLGGAFLGISAATIGGGIGSLIGGAIDSRIIASFAPDQRQEGARLDELRVTSATEGAVLPRLHGRMRVGGNIIWATDFREVHSETRQGGRGKGGGGRVVVEAYSYYASFAVAIATGPIGGIGRLWADGSPFDVPGAVWRLHKGSEIQMPDPLIEATMGAGLAPAYRGTAYVVFENLALASFGNRLPQLSFEVYRPSEAPDSAEQLLGAVTMIPSSGEFIYATEPITRSLGNGAVLPENVNSTGGQCDFLTSLDQLEATAPNCRSVSLVVAWFGTDLRAGVCQIRPGVETATKVTAPKVWLVNGVSRPAAYVVSQISGSPAYGGTPSDFSVVQALQELKARGFRVTFYPFLLMDVPGSNSLPNPWSDSAAALGQPKYPWRGRITCSPAAGFAGTVDKTAAAATQVSAFFGSASPANFSVSGTMVSWTGSPSDWGLRRMILHYAHLCVAAGGVDAFLIGSELRGITQIRSGASTYPAFPVRADVWSDIENYRLGHWLTGRIGGCGLAELVRELCRSGGVPDALIDVTQLAATVPGYAITAIESARASLAPLAQFYGFDVVETGGQLRFVPRGRAAVAQIAADTLVITERDAEDISFTRAQETELPRALKWRLLMPDEEYGALSVEARRISVQTDMLKEALQAAIFRGVQCRAGELARQMRQVHGPTVRQPHEQNRQRLSPAPQDREHVRAPQGLAQGRNPV